LKTATGWSTSSSLLRTSLHFASLAVRLRLSRVVIVRYRSMAVPPPRIHACSLPGLRKEPSSFSRDSTEADPSGHLFTVLIWFQLVHSEDEETHSYLQSSPNIYTEKADGDAFFLSRGRGRFVSNLPPCFLSPPIPHPRPHPFPTFLLPLLSRASFTCWTGEWRSLSLRRITTEERICRGV